MALHVVRDSQGRMEKILVEKEYRHSQFKSGCFGFILLACVLAYAYFNPSDTKPSNAKNEAVAEDSQKVETNTEDVTSSIEVVEAEDENEEYPASGEEEDSNVIDEDELVRRFQENQGQ